MQVKILRAYSIVVKPETFLRSIFMEIKVTTEISWTWWMHSHFEKKKKEVLGVKIFKPQYDLGNKGAWSDFRIL